MKERWNAERNRNIAKINAEMKKGIREKDEMKVDRETIAETAVDQEIEDVEKFPIFVFKSSNKGFKFIT